MRVMTTRRRILNPAVFTAPGLLAGMLGGRLGSEWDALAAQDASSTPATGQSNGGTIGEATVPDWRFAVLIAQDPYAGEIVRPANPKPNTRYVGCEVVITNGSDQPLDFSTTDVTLVDENAVAYPAGSIVGSEPRLVSQNLPDGERTRGWVWFEIPEDSVILDIRFTGPPPVFRIGFPQS